MIKFINKFTGSEMWVADKRKDEYVAAGHKLAAAVIPAKSAEPEKEPEKEKTVRKRMKK